MAKQRTIDTHTHICTLETAALITKAGVKVTITPEGVENAAFDVNGTVYRPFPTGGFDIARRLRDMDATGVDVHVLSATPQTYLYNVEPELAATVAAIQNDQMAKHIAAHPDRFWGIATLPLAQPKRAADELKRAMTKLGLRGSMFASNVKGINLDDPMFEPLWAIAEELGAFMFVHPNNVAGADRLKSYYLGNLIGNPLDTTIALQHLIFEGTLDRFPGLKICAAHGGGFLPSYANRSDAVIKTFPDRVGPLPKKNPTEYLRNGQLYFDTIMFTGEAMRHLIAEVGIEHVVMGTDYPFPWNTAPVDHILSIPGISDADKIAMLGGTAAKLLGIDS